MEIVLRKVIVLVAVGAFILFGMLLIHSQTSSLYHCKLYFSRLVAELMIIAKSWRDPQKLLGKKPLEEFFKRKVKR